MGRSPAELFTIAPFMGAGLPNPPIDGF